MFVSIAVADEESVDAVASNNLEEAFRSFEVYAAAGLRVISSTLEDSGQTRVDALLDLVETTLTKASPIEPVEADAGATLRVLGG